MMIQNKTDRPMSESDARWLDVKNRNVAADDQFVYAVKTTGIYCRPSCPAKNAKRENIEFFDSYQEAERAHYRACKRCKPNGESIREKNRRLVIEGCRLLEEENGDLTLSDLAAQLEISPHFFQRQFKKITGVTPKQYSKAIRTNNLQTILTQSDGSITDAIYNAGFNSSSQFYETSDTSLGMMPTIFCQGGTDTLIQFAIVQSSLGALLVARSIRGICTISLGDDPALLLNNLQDQFPNAEFIGNDADFDQMVAIVIGLIENPSDSCDPYQSLTLPLDIRGTAFEQQVWEALRTIPSGTTVTYTQLAEMIGRPKSIRAVANACGQNQIAVAIPCHRAVRLDGSLSGYRWGIERKRALLLREVAN